MAISCDPNDLLAAANCIQSCLTNGQMEAIQTKLLCDIASVFTGGGGGGGTGPWVLKAGDVMTGSLAIGTGSIGLTQEGILRLATNTTALGLAILEQASADTDPFDLNFRKTRGTITVPTAITSGDSLGQVNFRGFSGAAGYVTGAAIRSDSTGTIATTRIPGRLVFSTGTDAAPTVLTDAMTIDSTQFVGLNTLTPVVRLHASFDGMTPNSTLYNPGTDTALFTNNATNSQFRILAAGGLSAVALTRSGGTLSVPLIVANGDSVGEIQAQGYDGAARRNIAILRFAVDGVPGAGNIPGRILFLTAPPSGATTERMRIDSAGLVSAVLSVLAHNATAIPAGGTAGAGYMFSSTSNFGIFFGSNAPSLVAAKGSLYLRSNGSTTNDRAYIATDSAGTWTAIITVA